jgi:lantibiotic modifying enzyme
MLTDSLKLRQQTSTNMVMRSTLKRAETLQNLYHHPYFFQSTVSYNLFVAIITFLLKFLANSRSLYYYYKIVG